VRNPNLRGLRDPTHRRWGVFVKKKTSKFNPADKPPFRSLFSISNLAKTLDFPNHLHLVDEKHDNSTETKQKRPALKNSIFSKKTALDARPVSVQIFY
jgi:hypothetical protein